ncbi:MAG: hypothetical protein MUE66_01705 [Acidimicrobiia bacterium]|nr:hypothetical protein [Acidimicrobiia bacterium]
MASAPTQAPAAPRTAPQSNPAVRPAAIVVAALGLVQAAVAAVNLSPLIDHYTVAALVDVNGEANLTAWLSSAVLLVTAAGAGLAAVADRTAGASQRRWLGWALIAAFFVLLSADETAGLHELIGEEAHRLFDFAALPSLYTWVLVVAPVGMVAAFLMARWFVKAIGAATASGRLAIAAIALWLAVPALEALDPTLGGPAVLSVIEESLESAGEALMLAGVLVYLGGPGRLTALARRVPAPEEPTA